MAILAVIACHFKTKDTLCDTTLKRLDAALQEFRSCREETFFVLSGDVPYIPESRTLSTLMKNYLLSHEIHECNILQVNGGCGTFSEGRLVTEKAVSLLKGGAPRPKLLVVSSDWWLWSGLPVWRRFGGKLGLEVNDIPVKGTGGWHTWLIYAVYAVIVRSSLFVGLSPLVEKHLNAIQEKRRTEGFTWNGCA